MNKKKQVAKGGPSTSHMDLKNPDMGIKKIMRDIEFLGASRMTWKERKELENRKVVSLGGKPPKKQKLPLSVARVTMKKQKEREQKMLQESLILGRFGGKSSSAKRVVEKRKSENRGLKASEGHFRNGVLDVGHLLRRAPTRDYDTTATHAVINGKMEMGGGKNKGKKKGGGRKHR